MDLSSDALDGMLADWLRGDDRFPGAANPSEVKALLERIDIHGVAGLLVDRAKVALPAALHSGIRTRAVSLAFWEAQHRDIVSEALSALSASGVAPLVFKGTALAYSVYPDPALRQRGDTDVLVARDAFDEACRVLHELGFLSSLNSGGDLVLAAEISLVKFDRTGGKHDIDLHRSLNNSPALSSTFSYDELFARSVPLSGMGEGVNRAGDVDALLIACMHRLVHETAPYYVEGVPRWSADRLIWLEDIRLLSAALRDDQWRELIELAQRKGLAETTARGCHDAQRLVGAEAPAWVLRKLEATAGRERPARYLRSGRLSQLLLDLQATGGGQQKGKFILELLFPPREYIREKFPDARLRALPWLYLRRIVAGALKPLKKAERLWP